MQLEKSIQNAIIRFFDYVPGAFVYECYNGGLPARAVGNRIIYKKKNEKSRPNGFPDLIVFYRGKSILMETKIKKGKASDEQKKCHARLGFSGIEVHIVRSVADVVKIMEQFK